MNFHALVVFDLQYFCLEPFVEAIQGVTQVAFGPSLRVPALWHGLFDKLFLLFLLFLFLIIVLLVVVVIVFLFVVLLIFLVLCV